MKPDMLQTLISGSPVFNAPFGTLGGIKTFDSPPSTDRSQPTWFGQLMESFTQNLAASDFTSALADIKEIQHHMGMGLEHWNRFVTGAVS
jgi:hypothetical protein